ncbi:MAG: hypothetical protein HW390_756, partial [Candidatus Brocadiaceae bacterium]|nr:hypothetical protein [Candidatus Brocadiaceae bacterium]
MICESCRAVNESQINDTQNTYQGIDKAALRVNLVIVGYNGLPDNY